MLRLVGGTNGRSKAVGFTHDVQQGKMRCVAHHMIDPVNERCHTMHYCRYHDLFSFSALVIPPSPGQGLQVYKCQVSVTRTSKNDGLVAFHKHFCHDPVLE